MIEKFIPKSFQLFGRTVRVEIDDHLAVKRDIVGLTSEREDKIAIQGLGPCMSRDKQQQVFWHETVHTIFDRLNERELSGNEKLTDQIASCLHQIIKTAKF